MGPIQCGPNDIPQYGFDVDGPQITATIYFRKAWKFLPPTPDTINVEGDFSNKYANHTDEEWAWLPKNPEMGSVHTLWRERVYYLFNHLFYGAASFLVGMYGRDSVGHLHPLNLEAFGLNFPHTNQTGASESENVSLCTKTWETGLLLILSYLTLGYLCTSRHARRKNVREKQ